MLPSLRKNILFRLCEKFRKAKLCLDADNLLITLLKKQLPCVSLEAVFECAAVCKTPLVLNKSLALLIHEGRREP